MAREAVCHFVCLTVLVSGAGCDSSRTTQRCDSLVSAMDVHALQFPQELRYEVAFPPHLRDALSEALCMFSSMEERLVVAHVSPGRGYFVITDHWIDSDGNLVCKTVKYNTRRAGDTRATIGTVYVENGYISSDLALVSLYRNLLATAVTAEVSPLPETQPRVTHPSFTYLVLPEYRRVVPLRFGATGELRIDLVRDLGLDADELLASPVINADDFMSVVFSRWIAAGLGLPEIVDNLLLQLDALAESVKALEGNMPVGP